jgi:hypothetical protein
MPMHSKVAPEGLADPGKDPVLAVGEDSVAAREGRAALDLAPALAARQGKDAMGRGVVLMFREPAAALGKGVVSEVPAAAEALRRAVVSGGPEVEARVSGGALDLLPDLEK